jgi:N-acetylmuramoyl-L-alanine amidase
MTTLLRKGDRSKEVADVQARLRALGIDIADELGHFGQGTVQGVLTFQQSRGLIADGIVGPNTWSELVEASWRLGDRALYLRHPLMRGDDVLTLQLRLNALGFDAGREDGIFGSDTHRAVQAFQKEYDVAEDGIVGPVTLEALTGLRVERADTAAGLREEIRLQDQPGIHRALIVIDPGHGGDDPGDIGPNLLREADVCWDLARLVAERLVVAGARVRFTRTEIEAPDVKERAARANDLGAHAFISIHLNSHNDDAASGASTYFFRGSRAGKRLAESIQEGIVSLGLGDCRSHPQSYASLKETRMPAVIVEPCFITSPAEAARLERTSFRAALADAIAGGVRAYFDRSMLVASSSRD